MNTDNDEKTTTLMADLPPVAEHIFAASKDGFELVIRKIGNVTDNVGQDKCQNGAHQEYHQKVLSVIDL